MDLTERRIARIRARNLVLKSGEHPQVLEMYHLYRALESAYVDMLDRAMQAEEKADRIREFIGREMGDDANDERKPTRGDLRHCR